MDTDRDTAADPLAEITLNSPPEASDVTAALYKHGIVRLPNFLKLDRLMQLNEEFDRILAERRRLGFHCDEDQFKVNVRVVRKDLDPRFFPATVETFDTTFMRSVARSYFTESRIGLNHQIFVNLDLGRKEVVRQLPYILHFDKIHTLKFFFYLTDTSARNGAMAAVPSSHHENRERRLHALKRTERVQDIPNLVEGMTTISIDGSAGSLFIFDTDIAHQVGHVKPEQERRIMRGHTRTLDMLEQIGLTSEALEALS